ncbi:SPOR domain-containing protein [Sphingobacteriaceae bacterium WQ 2009]|uniref:SPOR domain-containing protein n=1 Tax=Rhinopithecimicrobium faecis TaxID=2820698 RepID=A0A8T4HAN0_9SPHI|nr:SPOR domain-containing protein [Sphingobacteriaceae bacterium WQ 2009]
MLKKGFVAGMAVVMLSISAHAQEKVPVEVTKDTLITLLQNFRANPEVMLKPVEVKPVVTVAKVIDKRTARRTSVRGFRVQIYTGSSRSQAYAEQARFRRLYKDVDTYVSYNEPNYRVKVGDFRSRSDANAYLRMLKSQFSNVFIFTEDIYVYQ